MTGRKCYNDRNDERRQGGTHEKIRIDLSDAFPDHTAWNYDADLHILVYVRRIMD